MPTTKVVAVEPAVRALPILGTPAGVSTLTAGLAAKADAATVTAALAAKADSSAVSNKQDKLISGESLRTINNQSLLGAGNMTVIADGVPPIALALPGISGTAQKGYTLTATSTTWVGIPTPSLTGVWQRDGVDIPGATSKTYTLTMADVGAYVSYKEVASNGITNSANTIGVLVADLPLPTATTSPSILGTPFKGQTLTLADGVYGNLAETTGIMWERNGAATGNTTNIYVMTDADTGASINVAVTVTNITGSSVFRSTPVLGVGPLYDGLSLQPLTADPIRMLDAPAAASSFIDPLYGMTILRGSDYTTDSPGSTYVRHVSSRQAVFNADASMYLASSSTGAWIVYDASASPLGIVSMDAGAEPVWDATNPQLLHYTAALGSLIWSTVNVVTGAVTVLKDFTAQVTALFPTAARVWLRGGCPSANGNVWTFSVEDAALVHLGLITWNFQTKAIIASLAANVHLGGTPEWVSTSPSGTYAVVSWAGSKGTVAYHTDFTAPRQIVATAPYGDLCVGTSNEDIFCYLDEVSNALMGVDCAIGTPFTILSLTWGSSFSKEFAKVTISGKAFDRPGWVFLSGYGEQYVDSTYSGTLSTIRAPWRKVFVAKLVPSGTSYSVAFLQTTADYGGAIGRPDAVPSRDGRKALFASNFGGQADPDVYIVSIPDKLVKGAPSAPVFISSPAISCPSGIFQTGQLFTCDAGAVDGEPFPVVSYQWKIDGVNAGTNASSFTPTTAGAVSCVVTLTNSQGVDSRASQSISIAAPLQALTVVKQSAFGNASTNVQTPSGIMSGVAAGDLIVVSAAFNYSTMTSEPTLVDPTGVNVFVALPAVKCADRNSIVKVWYCLSAAAGDAQINFDISGISLSGPSQVRYNTYGPGAGRHFEFDTSASIGQGYAFGDIKTGVFDTSDQGVVYTAFADDYYSDTAFPFAAPTGFTYSNNVSRPLVAAHMVTVSAMTNVVGTKPTGGDYSRGEVQTVSFVTKPN
jgi:hypothetical protein